jgi:hypothetical protein
MGRGGDGPESYFPDEYRHATSLWDIMMNGLIPIGVTTKDNH